jgi:polysaccharide export outer membrane protein
MIRKSYLSLLFMMSVLVSGCVIQPIGEVAAPSPSMPSQVMDAGNEAAQEVVAPVIAAYMLRPSDPIFIRFSGILEQQGLDVVIDEKGMINLLHIDHPVVAAGLTTSELEDQIERLYIDGGIYKTVSVNVTMTAMAYYVQGEVNAPGKFQLTGGTTLIQAIAEARGLTPFASKKVTVTRQGNIYTFNWKELEKDPSLDKKIEAGDVIKVWQSPW